MHLLMRKNPWNNCHTKFAQKNVFVDLVEAVYRRGKKADVMSCILTSIAELQNQVETVIIWKEVLVMTRWKRHTQSQKNNLGLQ